MGLLTPVAIRIGAQPWLPRFLPQIVWLDKAMHRLTRGRFSLLDLGGLPNLMLTVAGRKSGVPRTTPLLAVPRGATWLIAGSYFGGPDEPVWVRNLEAAQTAEITVKGRTMPVAVRRLEDDERAEAWRHMLTVWPNYAKYEERTHRTIKVFELTPR